jgi:hypothetical protein
MKHLNEVVANDTFFADEPAANDGILGHAGCEQLQLYVGKESQLTRAYPLRSKGDMYGSLEDFIRDVGAPVALVSDMAKEQIGTQVRQLLRMYNIADYQSEPYYHHQNYAERRIQEVKKMTNSIMDRTGTPAKHWLLCTLFVVALLNHLATASLDWKTPIEVATGQCPDISAILQFHWWEPVYYERPAKLVNYPSESKEGFGRWVGIAEKQGDVLTYLILDAVTEKVVVRSNVRSTVGSLDPNLRAAGVPPAATVDTAPPSIVPTDLPTEHPASVTEHIKTLADPACAADISKVLLDPALAKLPLFSPDELYWTFLHSRDA